MDDEDVSSIGDIGLGDGRGTPVVVALSRRGTGRDVRIGAQGGGDISARHPGGGAGFVPPLDLSPYETRNAVGSAKYVPPCTLGASRKASARSGDGYGYDGPSGADFCGYASAPASPRREGQRSKTERWRERGQDRWPAHAHEQQKRQPHQFAKAEEVVPLRRTLENPQTNIGGELFTRSLREKTLDVKTIGVHNPTVVSSAVRCLFDREGRGYSGKTNARGPSRRRPGEFGPHLKEWVEQPVATGRMALDHMCGSRYSMNMSPRDVVPNSMSSPRIVKLNTAR
eukprot:TRINITY_DN75504_c0_g1_i1.p1 TRINITY_DN75504_c0_g1~~TRINITY_DN75504_c0_g1_i1.p1  ORF type:complete len:284 (+),score=36.31 TRINITY_DN75504_c0_g1_i1:67-918(+)